MGIQDRDYMKRSPEEDYRDTPSGDDPWAAERQVETLLGSFFRKHPRFMLHAALGVVILVVVALLVAKFAGSAS